ncbi:MAG: M90 family metallopeptidase [Pseudomonadota bacterium]
MMKLFSTLFAPARPVARPGEADWHMALERPLFAGLSGPERARLQDLARQLLEGKAFTPAGDAEPTGEDIALIATQAALPILHLGSHWYDGWKEVVLYPAEFVHQAEETDEMGLVHQYSHVRAGEAWQGGPLILSLDAVRASGWLEGFNVIIHEFAHKLDMNSGAVNGLPPLHGDMVAGEWSRAFASAYEDLARRADAMENDADLEIDPYAAESPAEFFAVLSEYFFEWPEVVSATYPAVYEQMRRFYRQDPLKRLNATYGAAP